MRQILTFEQEHRRTCCIHIFTYASTHMYEWCKERNTCSEENVAVNLAAPYTYIHIHTIIWDTIPAVKGTLPLMLPRRAKMSARMPHTYMHIHTCLQMNGSRNTIPAAKGTLPLIWPRRAKMWAHMPRQSWNAARFRLPLEGHRPPLVCSCICLCMCVCVCTHTCIQQTRFRLPLEGHRPPLVCSCIFVCVCAYIQCVCACVCEREREREYLTDKFSSR